MEKGTSYIYSWFFDKSDKEITMLRAYGLNSNGENMCLVVKDFTPFVYVELPRDMIWNSSNSLQVGIKIDELMGYQKPTKKVLVFKKKLYGAFLDKDGKRLSFPYLFCAFSNTNDIYSLCKKLQRPVTISGIGSIKLKVHENSASPILQLTCCRKIPSVGWIKFAGKRVSEEDKISICEHEYNVKFKALEDCDSTLIPKLKVMCFDIEVYSSNPSMMPQAHKPKDVIFQISCIINKHGDDIENYKSYLLTLGKPDQNKTGKDVSILNYICEADLLDGFANFIQKEKPNIISGYNILGFDIPYMIDRSKSTGCFDTFAKQGFNKTKAASIEQIKWKSQAFGEQIFNYLNGEGVIFIDLLPIIKRDYKMSSYKLSAVSEKFIGDTKDDLSPQGIFKCYDIGMVNTNGEYKKRAQIAMGIVGKYCIQDSVLVMKLMNILQIWTGLSEMARICQSSVFSLYTQGQQIKVFSQLYKYCMFENIVVEKDYVTGENERYIGAHVFPPVPGRYSRVVPFDFASLYPSTIIAYNIDYHTWVPNNSLISDSECNVMEWEDHVGCEHDPKVIRVKTLNNYIENVEKEIKILREKRDNKMNKQMRKEYEVEIAKMVEELKPYRAERVEAKKGLPKRPMCEKRFYRFLKEPKGVLPTVIENLLNARKKVRNVDIVKYEEKIKLLKAEEEIDNSEEIAKIESILQVLEKRQLAFKVSANSMYGAMGVREGYLPFMPGAMCTCYMGRVNIEIVAKSIVEKYGGELVYGDTDSTYIHFPKLLVAHETWDHAIFVANEISKLFPRPIKLEFEKKIYDFFFILTKKKYMTRKCERDGIVSKKIGKTGVLLARRDNSKFIRDVYENVINKIADDAPKEDILSYLIDEINKLLSRSRPISDFVVTKAVRSYGSGYPEGMFRDKKGIIKGYMGSYIVKMLSQNEKTKIEEMNKKGANNEFEYYNLCLPAQIQLAEKMRVRGQKVEPGTRLEYVITDPDNLNGKQYEKIEHLDYVCQHPNIIKIDYMYYLNSTIVHIDLLLNIYLKNDPKFKKDFMNKQYEIRKNHLKVMSQIKKIGMAKIKFE